MAFSKKVETQGGSSVTNEQWNEWNESQWNLLDVTPTKLPNGKEVKEVDAIGILNFICEIGCQPQEDASMPSKVAAPKEDEDNSPEELAVIAERPSNYFEWVERWDNGVKKQERHVRWAREPEEELVLAVDFPTIKVDYGQHPAADGVGEVKPFRIDYNGKWKNSFQRTVTNEVHWKTNKFGDKDVKYKIASAAGNLEQYQSNGHDLADLVQATCNWTIRMTKNVTDNGTFYSTDIRDPSPIQEIKSRRDTYTVEEQLEDAACDVEFCGILLNGGDYPDENLAQVRDFWWEKAKQSIQYDKNEGTTRTGEWLKGCNWEDSDLAKAYEAFQNKNGKDSKPVGKPQKSDKPEPKQTPAEQKKSPVSEPQEPVLDFDEEVPFSPVWLPYGKSSILAM